MWFYVDYVMSEKAKPESETKRQDIENKLPDWIKDRGYKVHGYKDKNRVGKYYLERHGSRTNFISPHTIDSLRRKGLRISGIKASGDKVRIILDN